MESMLIGLLSGIWLGILMIVWLLFDIRLALRVQTDLMQNSDESKVVYTDPAPQAVPGESA